MRKHFYCLLAMFASCLVSPLSQVQAQTTPATWQEHWFEHVQLLQRVYLDNDLALYYDNDVSRSVTWPNQFLSDVWRYTKKTYGSFGTEPQLYAVMHTNKYSGGHPSTYFDASHDFRNVIDAGPGNWTGATEGDHNLLTHEVGHIVEIGSKNTHGSPAFGIWGDSKWAEIYIYDVYKGLGLTTYQNSVYTQFTAGRDNFPRANTAWFRDWFYPIYNQYGGTQVLNRYFVQVALYFARSGSEYNGGMNMGEFVHFWSGAAGVNLKSLATTAFGWTSEYETQFVQAQQKYPFTYSTPKPIVASLFQDINYGGYGVYLPEGNYNLTTLRAYGARNDDVTSLKVAAGYRVTFYMDDNFTGSSKVFTADAASMEAGWNDQVSSIRVEKLAAATVSVAPEEKDGLSVSSDKGLVVFPNPVSRGSSLTVRVTEYDAKAPLKVSLVDVNKTPVVYQTANAATVSVNTGNVAGGVYVLVVTNGSRYYTKKIVVQ
ncbi:T9SS type A sorting domain-containing protein [Chitinophaga pinensis]|uniref:Beta/gamma crystallin 'Greek key' domain-containing protein n=1 Tax=Chitinophaga pinensis (strain ATCC 43595 / DSM 2588 / LMG 13176 / NBRC 15968 / NCIMB 11800 / UQM 2034) TaxID=485918 RepID=A0A979GTD1_CHIPD|nr:T9SS type A sorting domain-containing protein [Chitinophaga pinensis]ACU60064.1 hypothetical protein Cpin_2581 [Chitinophaga pinensis DSM 2588]